MCLNSVKSDTILNKIKDTIPEDGLKVYKVVEVKDDKYHPLYQNRYISFAEGENRAYTRLNIMAFTMEYYRSGFHFWLKKEDANRNCTILCRTYRYNFKKFKVIECIVKKEWITAVGKNTLCENLRTAIVACKAIFPTL